MDSVSPEVRSRMMSRVKSRNTEPELLFRKWLREGGYSYRLSKRGIPGTPDIWIGRRRTAIFINGCFWHRHAACGAGLRYPKSRQEYWIPKLDRNLERDREVRERLLAMGIRYIDVWECSIRRMAKDPVLKEMNMKAVLDFLEGYGTGLEI